MAKIISTLVIYLIGVVITIQGLPSSYDEIVAAAKTGQWDQISDLLSLSLATETAYKPLAFNSVRNLKPSDGGQVYGEAEYSYHSASNINGKTLEDAGGHKIINVNGQVTEFNFTPTTHKTPLYPISFSNVRNLKPPQDGHVYGEAEYTYHTASNINGKTSEDAGGHKVINNNGRIKEYNFKPTNEKSVFLQNLELAMLQNNIKNLHKSLAYQYK